MHARNRTLIVLLLSSSGLLGACQEYGVSRIKEPVEVYDTSEEEHNIDTSATVTPDECADVAETLASDVATNEDCVHEISTGTLDAVIEWSMADFGEYPEYSEVVMTPVVGQLTDDDGDGEITREDTPDIVIIGDDGGQNSSEVHGVIRIISGDGSTIHKTMYETYTSDGTYQVYAYRYSGAALGDIDADGLPDIVAIAQKVLAPTDTGGGDSDSGESDTQPPESSADSGGGGGDESGPRETGDPIRPPPPDGGSGGGGGGGDSGGGEGDHDSSCYVAAWTNEGELKWISEDPALYCAGIAPALADMDGDGAVEIVIGPYILNGLDGTLRGTGAGGVGRFEAYKQVGFIPIVIDLDNDGDQEVVTGTDVYDADGETICSVPDGYEDGFTAAADLDGDGEGEFVVVGDANLRVFDADCSFKDSWTLSSGGTGGPPTISDFDADGQPEIGVAGAYTYDVYEADGTLLWTSPITDASSHATGSSVHDFEADGHPEVLYADEDTLWIFDGATGDVRLADSAHTSRTLHEYPVVVDVDGDGSAEIVVPNGGSHYASRSVGLYVIGSESSTWYGNRQVWNQHAYNIVNINDDLSVPAEPESNWPDHNNFRSGDPNPPSGGDSPDAVPLAELCLVECDSNTVELRVKVGNEGAALLRSNVGVSIYADYGIGRKLLTTGYTTDDVAPGLASTSLSFRFDLDEVEDANLVIVVDDEAGVEVVPECVETNNEMEFSAGFCAGAE